MNLKDLFRRVPSITAEEVRHLVEAANSSETTILDVRQPAEYESGHIPGAFFIPLGELHERLHELDPAKQIIAQCRSGSRSRSATEILLSAGFRSVFNMEGGILAWRGITVTGFPEATMFCVPQSLDATELLTMAWAFETGTLDFLHALASKAETGTKALLSGLIKDKEESRESLKICCSGIKGIAPERFAECAGPHCEGVMVGCIRVEQAIQWAKGKSATDILELLVSLSASAYDYYVRLARVSDREDARTVFAALAERERTTIGIAAKVLEKAV